MPAIPLSSLPLLLLLFSLAVSFFPLAVSPSSLKCQVLRVLELAKGMPYLIRGSAAGSLVCYLLAISHIDPVKEGMSLVIPSDP